MAATEEIEKEILAEMAANPVPYAAGQVNDVITIDGETRMISVPASEIFFGVESDKDVERKHFRCPKVVGDGIDLSKHQIYISYITSDSAGKTFSGNAGLYLCEDVATDGDDITFSWQLSGNVFASAGFIAFKVLAAKTDGENVQTRWNTVPAIGTVLMTVPDGMDIGEAYPDIVTQLLERMASVEKIATEEAMQGYVNTYLEAHPGEIDETLTDPKKAAPASVVGELKEDIGGLNDIIVSRPNMLDSRCVIKQYEYINGVTGQIAQNPNDSRYWALETYLPIEQGKTYISNCQVQYFYVYDSGKNFIERVNTQQKSSVWKYLTINDERYAFARVYFDTSAPSDFGSNFFFGELDENAVYSDAPTSTTANLVTKYNFVTDDTSEGGKDAFSDFVGNFEKQNYSWVDGSIQASGEMTSSSAFHRSDFVKVPEKAMLYKLKGYSIRADLCSIAFYSTNNKSEIISSVVFSTDVGEFVGVIPPNAKYYAVSKLKTNNGYSVELFINKEIGQIINDNSHDILNIKNSRMLTDGLGFVAFSKFASVGDSLSVGYNTHSDGTVVPKDLEHSWGKYVEKRTGSKAYWTGVHGATCKSWLTTSSEEWGLNYTKTLGEMPLYVVCMGANEDGTKLGTIADVGTNADTLYAYASKVITELRAISPKCFIVCTGISRKQANKTINAVFKAICDLYDKCYFMDCWDEFNHAPFSNYHFASHYSANGYAMMAQLFDYKLKEIMANHIEDFKYINECEV